MESRVSVSREKNILWEKKFQIQGQGLGKKNE